MRPEDPVALLVPGPSLGGDQVLVFRRPARKLAEADDVRRSESRRRLQLRDVVGPPGGGVGNNLMDADAPAAQVRHRVVCDPGVAARPLAGAKRGPQEDFAAVLGIGSSCFPAARLPARGRSGSGPVRAASRADPVQQSGGRLDAHVQR